ncbi:ferredoxin-NADP reductase [Thermocatellispora tengchongensis]|uniref:Ferredoxin-NADP reductase n=1 Tax=Thermocatellispora tengchongensis TaxID=1073253 RepID=A0A840PJX8_9ACTN|nr:PDR/VanB family oxidoreductase [Thermocatellispora tengchongensis]MBB5139216.1 ferredoxin-NADP reductase [Thermocatellispora tengchongensis]
MSEAELKLFLHRREAVADGVALLDLRAPGGGTLPPWEPGAHVDLVLGGGLVRQYSLCGDPADRDRYLVAVLREPAGRGGSAYVHDRMAPGQAVPVRGPRNHFPLVPAERYLFLAGGIGITPLVPMLAAVTERGAPWRLVYGGRTRRSMAFLPELVDRYGDRVVVCPQDETGLLDLEAELGVPRPGTAVYCCGPEPLLAAAERVCAAAGWPPDALRVERFAPRPDAGAPRTAFDVELAATGRTLRVPADRSILDVLGEAGVAVMSSCEEGTCGTCETAVLAGEPDHRDSVLSERERASGRTLMICVSRARGDRLVLDL